MLPCRVSELLNLNRGQTMMNKDKILTMLREASDEDKVAILSELFSAAKRVEEKLTPAERIRRHKPAPCSKCGCPDIVLISDCSLHEDLDGFEGSYDAYKCPRCGKTTGFVRDPFEEWEKINPWPDINSVLEWEKIDVPVFPPAKGIMYECSVCHSNFSMHDSGEKHMNECPYCGAKLKYPEDIGD